MRRARPENLGTPVVSKQAPEIRRELQHPGFPPS